jgi:cytochrome c-type biogenesis protein CcsB
MSFDGLASWSDALMMFAVIGYVTATAAHGLDIVLAAPARARLAVVPARREFVAVGGQPPDDPTPEAPTDRPLWTRHVGTAAVGVTWLTAGAHLGAVLTRGIAADRVPLGNMYEFILTATLTGAVAWLVTVTRRPVRTVGLFVTLALALLLGGAGRVHVRVAPLVPALDSPWLKIHVAAAATSAGLMLVAFVAAVLYLLRLRHDAAVAAGGPTGLAIAAMPAAMTLDRLTFRLLAVAFPLWTFAVICGAIWAEAAWGRYWNWDPKETWAFVSWVLYAGYLHARNTAGWRGRPAALIVIAAWTTMMVNLFAVNMLFPSLHSYAGL